MTKFSSNPLKVSGDVTIGGNVKIGDVVGGAQIVTGDSNSVIVTPAEHGVLGKPKAAQTGPEAKTPATETGINFGDYIGIKRFKYLGHLRQPLKEVPSSEQAFGRIADVQLKLDKLQLKPQEVLSSEQALGRIADAVRLNLGQLQLNMEQARRESSQFFRTTMIFSGIAFVIILGGISLMLANLVTIGIVTTAASIIPEAGALLLFNKDKELRKTIETYHGYILESQRVLTMIDLAETMVDSVAKDSVKEQIVFAVLKVNPPKEA
jgi:hypothetical protein